MKEKEHTMILSEADIKDLEMGRKLKCIAYGKQFYLKKDMGKRGVKNGNENR